MRPQRGNLAVVIYPSRSIERKQNHQFGNLLALNQVQRNLIKEGFNSEKIAQLLSLPLDTVKQIVEENYQEN